MSNPNTRSPVGRRRFLHKAACSLSAAAMGLAHGREVGGIEPIRRDQPALFKFSLAAYSYRKLLKGPDASLTLMDFIDDCADFGLHGTELTSYYFPESITKDYLLNLKHRCFRLGLDVSGTAVGNDFGLARGDERDQQIRALKQWIDHAETLGAPVIRVFAGHQHDGISASETHRLIVDGLQECCDYAGKRGVHLALENHGGPTATADGLLALVKDVDSPWFGVNLDTGNFHTADIYGDLERVAPYALNVQVKATISGPDGQKHPSDYPRLAGILRRTSYRGYIVLEYEDEGDPRERCRHHLQLLRNAFTTG